MSDFLPIYIYCGVICIATLTILALSSLFRSVKDTPDKFLNYESGIRTETKLTNERFPIHHYLIALLFLVFDIEVIFLYPWAVVAKALGIFAFYEMLFFLLILLVGFAYIWRKGGLQWQ